MKADRTGREPGWCSEQWEWEDSPPRPCHSRWWVQPPPRAPELSAKATRLRPGSQGACACPCTGTSWGSQSVVVEDMSFVSPGSDADRLCAAHKEHSPLRAGGVGRPLCSSAESVCKVFKIILPFKTVLLSGEIALALRVPDSWTSSCGGWLSRHQVRGPGNCQLQVGVFRKSRAEGRHYSC